jgi:hypothetical protein
MNYNAKGGDRQRASPTVIASHPDEPPAHHESGGAAIFYIDQAGE